MKLRFASQATQDLNQIADFIRAENPLAATRVRTSILESLQVLNDFPRIGRRQSVAGVRKHVARKYGYLMYYAIDEEAAEVVILAIRHPARDRDFQDR